MFYLVSLLNLNGLILRNEIITCYCTCSMYSATCYYTTQIYLLKPLLIGGHLDYFELLFYLFKIFLINVASPGLCCSMWNL